MQAEAAQLHEEEEEIAQRAADNEAQHTAAMAELLAAAQQLQAREAAARVALAQAQGQANAAAALGSTVGEAVAAARRSLASSPAASASPAAASAHERRTQAHLVKLWTELQQRKALVQSLAVGLQQRQANLRGQA